MEEISKDHMSAATCRPSIRAQLQGYEFESEPRDLFLHFQVARQRFETQQLQNKLHNLLGNGIFVSVANLPLSRVTLSHPGSLEKYGSFIFKLEKMDGFKTI